MTGSFKDMGPQEIFKSLASEPDGHTYRTRAQIIEAVAVYAHRTAPAHCGKLIGVLTEMVEYFERGGQGNALPSQRHVTQPPGPRKG
jgi:hypothetical protein